MKSLTSWLSWLFGLTMLSTVVGGVVALFLWLLDLVTQFRIDHSYIMIALPLAGLLIYILYTRFGKNSDAGNTLILNTIHTSPETTGGVPGVMAPLVLLTTLITHLFGGSAGREGTAVQIGGSIASVLATWGKYTPEKAKILLICGISSGFGAVFGTPIAGAIFALEVVYSLGKRPLIQKAILPSLYTSVLADIICRGVGGYHTQYTMASYTTDLMMILKVVGAGCLFGGAGYLFIQVTHWIKSKSHQYISKKGLIPMVGGALVIGIATLLSGQEYLGLGVTTPNAGGVSIVSAFTAGGADLFSWAWKLLLTAITVGMGFKGGEVTPLFFIGATLGNTIATLTNAPIDLFAGLGFISVFAAATNTPIACTIMGMELFGIPNTLYFAIACITAYRVSGRGTIYQK